MAIVREYKHGNATIRIHDDAYAHMTQEEMDRKKEEFRQFAGRLFWQQMEENERRMAKKNEEQ